MLNNWEKFKRFYESGLTRIGLGAIAIATAVAAIPKAENLSFDLDKAIGVATAIAAWIGAEILSIKTEPHPHDVELRRKLRLLIEPDLEFLRDHDFGGTFELARMKNIRLIAGTWLGVQYHFQDPNIEKLWATLLIKISEFSSFVAHNSWPIHGSPEFCSFKNGIDEREGLTKKTSDKMARANEMASDIYEGLDQLELVSLKRIGQHSPNPHSVP